MEPVAVALIRSLRSFRWADALFTGTFIERGYSVGNSLSREGEFGLGCSCQGSLPWV